MADAYLALAAFLGIELMAVGVLHGRELAGGFELLRAVAWLLPIGLAAAAPVAVLAGVVVEVLRRGASRRRAVAAAFAALFAGAAAFGVAGGRHFNGGTRALFAAVLAAGAGAAAFWLAPRTELLESRERAPAPPAAPDSAPGGATPTPIDLRARALPWVLVAVVVALEVVNARVLPRLYPAFHHGLLALTFLVAALAGGGWSLADGPLRSGGSPWTPKLTRAAAALALFALAAAVAPGAARRQALSDNLRLVYLDHAPALGRVVELGARIAPPLPLDDGPAPTAATVAGGGVDLRGRDFLLVTIDALRADHVGAYGYERPITPRIDRLATEGLLFEAAYTQTPHTSYALTSLMTGKYLRPLVLQGMGDDSETWAGHLRHYGYRTAAFYPPAVFFIDGERLASFRERGLDFEYRKVEFAPAAARIEQVQAYLASVPDDQRLFLWVHLFEPHEPYEAHAEWPLGDRDIDRYDAEIAAADAGLGGIVDAVRARRPGAVVVVAADHGEEFLEHGGRYHGTTVYDEQVRVPLVISAPGLVAPRRVPAPVQLVDVLPTVLGGLEVPRPARVRGNDLGALLAGKGDGGKGFAFSETDEQTLFARGALRLLCARRIGACALYDTARDPRQRQDVARSMPAEVAEMRAELRTLEASHGRYEVRGQRAEGKGWPDALRRGMAGDGDAALDVAALLEDADAAIRRKAGEVLFELRRPEGAAALRLAAVRDEDDEVRRWAALALTRLGEGAARTHELVRDPEPQWRRLAALALAEQGDDAGEDVLVAWWREAWPAEKGKTGKPIPFERAKQIAEALGRLRSEKALIPLCDALDDVRLRPHLAAALARIGEDAARPALATRLETERYQTARVAMVEALLELGAGPELLQPLIRLLGTPDPLPDGLQAAMRADLLEHVGGPRKRDLERLRRFATSGVGVGVVVPKAGNGSGVRVLCRVRTRDDRPGEIRAGMRVGAMRYPARGDKTAFVPKDAPELDAPRSTTLQVPGSKRHEEVFATLPASTGIRGGDWAEIVFYATQNVEVDACALLPLSDEIPPPAPEPWSPEADAGAP
ncbi:MAG: sulfatase-like hydrolase/transferase [Polyangiaceae bacterium]